MEHVEKHVAHYDLLEPIGAGAMGEVYKAWDKRLGRTVAIKLVRGDASDPSTSQALEEARFAARINHPNVATIYDVGKDDSGFYIVMEYVEGRSLKDVLNSESLTVEDALVAAIGIAQALQAAHGCGIVHRDIKPANVILMREGLKVLDFGLASALTYASAPVLDQRSGKNKTEAGDVKPSGINGEKNLLLRTVSGTLAYMSPEQLTGEPVDSRSDLFSLGVVIYELLAGRKPFEGSDRSEIVTALLRDEPPPLSSFRDNIPLELEQIVRQALRKNPADRYQSAEALATDLKSLLSRMEVRHRASDRLQSEPAKDSRSNFDLAASTSFWRASRLQAIMLAIALVCAAAAIIDVAIFHPHSVELFRAAILLALAIICSGLFAAQRRKDRRISRRPEAAAGAFRGLLPFQESDRDRFFGRESEIGELIERLMHHDLQLAVLYGESGSGKTSLLRAGLMPRLWERGFIALYCRSYKDPIAALFDECRRQTQIAAFEGEPAAAYLERVSKEMGAGVVIVWDQFEEFFVTFKTATERRPLVNFLFDCQNQPALRIKNLLSIRSDFLHLIWSEFSESVNEPLASSRLYHLRKFDRERAARIIDRSAECAGLSFAPDLSRIVARDLASGEEVLPSELQIVGERLQSKAIYTVQAYRKAGGKEQLVHSFLEDVILASGDEEGARLLLRCLISDENTRLTLSMAEISRRMQKSRESVNRLVHVFTGARLLREIQDDDPWRYELMHEYLIDRINQITGRVIDATQRANRLLRQYGASYLADKRTRIPITKVFFIRRYSDIERGPRERELLKKSLRWGLAKAVAAGLLLIAGSAVVAAGLSVNEQWDSVRLSDGHSAAVLRTVFSPDGKLLASCGEDSKIIVWDFARRQRLATLEGHTAWVNALAFSPDGKWLASGSDDRTIIIWNAATFEKAHVLSGGFGQVKAMSFSRDGKFLVSSHTNESSTITWRVDGWQKTGEAPFGASWGSLLFTPDNRYVMDSNNFRRLDLLTGEPTKSPFEEWGGNDSAFSPDCNYIVSANSGGDVLWIDFKTAKLLSRQRAHRFHGRAVAFSPDGRLVATAAEDIVLWDAASRTKLLRLEHTAEVWSLAFSKDGKWLVSGNADGSVLVWDVNERELAANFNGHNASVRSVAFSSDGRKIATAGEDRSVIVWDLERDAKEAVLIGHDTRVTAVAFSPDGRFVASSDQWSHTIYWDLATGSPVWRSTYRNIHSSGQDSSYCVAVSPDQRWVAFTSGVFDASNGRLVVDYYSSPSGAYRRGDQVYGTAFSPDGRWLVCAAPVQQAVAIWDTQSWEQRSRIVVEGAFLNSISFSPDGRELVSGEDQGAVRLWQADPLREIGVIGHHTGRVKSVDFSADGTQVISSGEDQTIALWDVSRRKLITRIGTHTSPVLSVAFSPDGKRIASGEHDKSVRIYTRHRSLWGWRLDN